MLRKPRRVIGVILISLIGIAIMLVVGIYLVSEARLNMAYQVQPETVAIPNDQAAIDLGKHVAVVHGCLDCHGADLAGDVVVDDPMVGLIAGSNLTSGEGGIGGSYSDADWVRAIRHGIRPDGKPLVIMPAWELYHLSDEDLGAVIAYMKTIPPVDKPRTAIKLTLLTRTLFLTDQLFAPLISAEVLDHTGRRPESPEPGVTREYGEYLTIACTGCHGAHLSGGPMPGAPSDWPPPLNLTVGGGLQGWSADDFIHTLRTGVTPSGRQLDPQYMPWPITAQMTDDELRAIYLYLQSVPALPYGNR